MGRIVTVTPNAALDLWTTTERLRSGSKLRASAPELYPGGGGVNVSRVLRRLGGETVALFAAGGWTGDEIAAALERERVPCRRVAISGVSRQNVNIREEESGDVYRIVMPGPTLTEDEQDEILDRATELTSAGQIVVGSGSLPPDTRPTFWAELAARVKQAGASLLLDSSSQVGAAMDEGIWLLRENKDEIVDIAGQDVDWPGGVADWCSSRIRDGACEVALVTHGGEGALLVTQDTRVTVKPPDVEVNSAIGAGDSFVAGLCLSLVQGEPPETALGTGVAAAAATLLTPGTELCRKEDVERLVHECGEPQEI